MAAEDEGRTEEASAYRLEQARKEGRVPKSQEIASSLVLLFAVLVLVFLARWIFGQCVSILRYYFARCSNPDISDRNLYTAFLESFLKLVLPIALVAVTAGFIGNIIQNRGMLFSWKPIEPKFSKIAPKFGEYFRRTMFSATGLFNIAKSIGKVAVIALIAYFLIKKDLFVLIDVISTGQVLSAVGKISRMAAQLLIIVAVLFLVISIPDYFVQRREFKESMKMTKQEVKQEFKELEGDPEVKGRLQQMQRQLLSQNVRQAVAESDVVITNPTHFAVALKYDTSVADAPRVVAKGASEQPEGGDVGLIKRIARENDVPIEENRPLARELYAKTEIGDIIPVEYYQLISVIYSHLENFKTM